MYPQAFALSGAGGNLPLHRACTDRFIEGGHISVEIISALVDGYRDAVSAMNSIGITPRHNIEDGEHPEEEEILRSFDSA